MNIRFSCFKIKQLGSNFCQYLRKEPGQFTSSPSTRSGNRKQFCLAPDRHRDGVQWVLRVIDHRMVEAAATAVIGNRFSISKFLCSNDSERKSPPEAKTWNCQIFDCKYLRLFNSWEISTDVNHCELYFWNQILKVRASTNLSRTKYLK